MFIFLRIKSIRNGILIISILFNNFVFAQFGATGNMGFDNTVHNSANGIAVADWALWYGRNTALNAFGIESPVSSKPDGLCSSSGTTHNDAANSCHTGIKVYNNNFQHHDIILRSSLGGAEGGIMSYNLPAPPNLSGTNTKCIRLGGLQQSFQEASGIKTTWTVSHAFLAYHYILRFEKSIHTSTNRGFVTMSLKNAGGTTLACGNFQMYENDPGETWTYNASDNVTYMAAWRTRIIDVSAYVGSTITIEVWAADCQEGAHATWGFFDFEGLAAPQTGECTILPIELITFDGYCDNAQKVTLNWATASETNNDYFEVQRSVDAINFSTIVNVDGAGNSRQLNQYKYVDLEPLSGTFYYRLKQIDFDGKFSYSQIIDVNCKSINSGTFQVYPNPGSNELIIEISDKSDRQQNFEIINSIGQVIQQGVITNKLIIQTAGFASGMYLIKADNGESIKWIKE